MDKKHIEEISEGLNKVIDDLLTEAKKAIAHGDPRPMFIVLDSLSKRMTIIPAEFRNYAEKEAVFNAVKGIAADMKADTVVSSVVSYMVLGVDGSVGVDDIGPGKKYRSVKEHPAAREVFMISVETLSGYYFGTSEIIMKGKKRALGKMEFQRFVEAKGIMVEFLPKPTIH